MRPEASDRHDRDRLGRLRRVGGVVVAALVVAGCGGLGPGEATVAPSPSSVSPPGGGGSTVLVPGSAPVSPPETVPLASAESDATSWPRAVADAVLALAAADGELRRAHDDLAAAVDAQDPAAVAAAAERLANYLDQLLPLARTLAAFPPTAPVGSRLVDAYGEMAAGARGMADAVRRGDGAGLAQATSAMAAGLSRYGEVRGPLSDLVPEALRHKRALGQ